MRNRTFFFFHSASRGAGETSNWTVETMPLGLVHDCMWVSLNRRIQVKDRLLTYQTNILLWEYDGKSWMPPWRPFSMKSQIVEQIGSSLLWKPHFDKRSVKSVFLYEYVESEVGALSLCTSVVLSLKFFFPSSIFLKLPLLTQPITDTPPVRLIGHIRSADVCCCECLIWNA